ncbi:hypothetical protein PAXRUDRAFT_385108 [Paxillus rubicundulus Ve08.2h10]|uniref:Uncharacterized protein n=1 Tax=Paxillus rubicundulus Ve08.2h10 TaxID=930991 RepID=A0A0D0DYS4_9AGAM|nr:hypothetical protein PAXRUDRAFT_385108 [Paxillus rubicundulus Ve08.2h10]
MVVVTMALHHHVCHISSWVKRLSSVILHRDSRRLFDPMSGLYVAPAHPVSKMRIVSAADTILT